MDCVVDAGALLELLLRGSRADAVENALRGRRIAAPSHLDVDVLAALQTLRAHALIQDDRAGEVLTDLYTAPVDRYSVRTLLKQSWALDGLSAYDACYVVLAGRLGCPLVTIDQRIAQVRDLPAEVIAV